MEKQIEEIYEILVSDCNEDCKQCKHSREYDMCIPRSKAEALYNAGYRKQPQDGAECPICHGTSRIGTTDWLTKDISKKQLAQEKAKACAEYDQQVKSKAIKDVFDEIEKNLIFNTYGIATISEKTFAEIKQKYAKEM